MNDKQLKAFEYKLMPTREQLPERVYLLIPFLTLLILLSRPSSAAPCEQMLVNGSDAWEPVSYREDPTKALKGIALDVMREVGRRLNIEIRTQRDLPWLRLFLALDSGKLDALLGAYHTVERAQKYLYTDAFMEEEIRIFVNRNHPIHFTTLKDLVGKRGMRPLGGSYGTTFDEFDAQYLTTQRYTDAALAFKLLNAGRIDYIVLAHHDGMATTKKLHYDQQISPLDTPVAKLPVYFLFSKNSSCAARLPEINRILSNLTINGFTDKLKAQYISARKH